MTSQQIEAKAEAEINAADVWERRTIEDMLRRFNVVVRSRYSPEYTKEIVFNRVRVLRAEGYCGSVAFAMALKEHNF